MKSQMNEQMHCAMNYRFNLRRLMSLLAMFCLPVVAPLALAGHHEGGNHDHGQQAATAEPAQKIRAEIRKIDAENGKITLKHEAIPQFNMMGMTMIFRVEDPALLTAFSVGDQVRFVPAKKNGQYVIESIEKAD